MDREPTDSGPEREPKDQRAGAAEVPFPAAPRMLSRRAAPPPLPAPLRDSEELASLHVKFARLVTSAQGDATDAAGTAAAGGGGVRAKVRARVAAVARADAGADREFMGDLVRAVAALAERLDDITGRVADLELLVQDVLDRLSEDLVRVQAALGTLGDPVERPGSGE